MDALKPPFIMSVVGPKRTGKTTFIKNLLKDHLLQHFKYVIIFSPTAELSGDFDEIANDKRSTFIKKTKTEDFGNCAKSLFERLETLKLDDGQAPNTLLLLDDCGTDPILNANSMLDKYSIRHRHAGLSILAVGHSLRGTCGLPKALRQQVDVAVFFNPSSMSEMEAILKEVLFSQHLKAAKQKAVEVFGQPYNYIAWIPAAPYFQKLLINFETPLVDDTGERPRKKRRGKNKDDESLN